MASMAATGHCLSRQHCSSPIVLIALHWIKLDPSVCVCEKERVLVGRLLGDSILHFHCLPALFRRRSCRTEQLPYFYRRPSEGTKMLYFANQHRLAALQRKHTTVLLVSPIFSPTAFSPPLFLLLQFLMHLMVVIAITESVCALHYHHHHSLLCATILPFFCRSPLPRLRLRLLFTETLIIVIMNRPCCFALLPTTDGCQPTRQTAGEGAVHQEQSTSTSIAVNSVSIRLASLASSLVRATINDSRQRKAAAAEAAATADADANRV